MRIGDKNKRVDIEAPTQVPDGMGGFQVAFTTIASSVAASIWPVSAAEIIAANAPGMVITHRIRMRFRKDIKSNWRLRYHNTYFNITAIID